MEKVRNDSLAIFGTKRILILTNMICKFLTRVIPAKFNRGPSEIDVLKYSSNFYHLFASFRDIFPEKCQFHSLIQSHFIDCRKISILQISLIFRDS